MASAEAKRPCSASSVPISPLNVVAISGSAAAPCATSGKLSPRNAPNCWGSMPSWADIPGTTAFSNSSATAANPAISVLAVPRASSVSIGRKSSIISSNAGPTSNRLLTNVDPIRTNPTTTTSAPAAFRGHPPGVTASTFVGVTASTLVDMTSSLRARYRPIQTEFEHTCTLANRVVGPLPVNRCAAEHQNPRGFRLLWRFGSRCMVDQMVVTSQRDQRLPHGRIVITVASDDRGRAEGD